MSLTTNKDPIAVHFNYDEELELLHRDRLIRDAGPASVTDLKAAASHSTYRQLSELVTRWYTPTPRMYSLLVSYTEGRASLIEDVVPVDVDQYADNIDEVYSRLKFEMLRTFAKGISLSADPTTAEIYRNIMDDMMTLSPMPTIVTIRISRMTQQVEMKRFVHAEGKWLVITQPL